RLEVGELAEAAVGRRATVERLAFAFETGRGPAFRRAAERARDRLRVADDVVHVVAAGGAVARGAFAETRLTAARRRRSFQLAADRVALLLHALRERDGARRDARAFERVAFLGVVRGALVERTKR